MHQELTQKSPTLQQPAAPEFQRRRYGATATATPTKPLSNDALQTAVAQRLAAWQHAWRNKQVDGYLGFYAGSFVPDKLKRGAWEQDRRTKLNKPGAIELQMGEPTYEIKDGVVQVSFNKEYSSFNYKDSTRKTTTWVTDAGVWRIQRESTLWWVTFRQSSGDARVLRHFRSQQPPE